VPFSKGRSSGGSKRVTARLFAFKKGKSKPIKREGASCLPTTLKPAKLAYVSSFEGV